MRGKTLTYVRDVQLNLTVNEFTSEYQCTACGYCKYVTFSIYCSAPPCLSCPQCIKAQQLENIIDTLQQKLYYQSYATNEINLENK